MTVTDGLCLAHDHQLSKNIPFSYQKLYHDLLAGATLAALIFCFFSSSCLFISACFLLTTSTTRFMLVRSTRL